MNSKKNLTCTPIICQMLAEKCPALKHLKIQNSKHSLHLKQGNYTNRTVHHYCFTMGQHTCPKYPLADSLTIHYRCITRKCRVEQLFTLNCYIAKPEVYLMLPNYIFFIVHYWFCYRNTNHQHNSR